MSYPVRTVEGIGPKFEARLHAAGIKSTQDLLSAARTPAKRSALADTAEIRPDLVLTWANRADLMRINGIGAQFAELLNVAGVDTVRELARRNADNLHAKLVEVNGKRNLCKSVPSAKQIAGFVAAAGELGGTLEY